MHLFFKITCVVQISEILWKIDNKIGFSPFSQKLRAKSKNIQDKMHLFFKTTYVVQISGRLVDN